MKIWLIQEVIAPYRIKLFEKIAETREIEFKLILLSTGLRHVPQWDFSSEEISFKAERVPGWCFYTGYEEQICINPVLLLKMLREKPDIVVCAGFSFATLLTLIYRFITGNAYVLWSEGTPLTESGLSPWRKALRKIMSRFAGAFVVAGSLSKKYVESLLPKSHNRRFIVSYNCVDNRFFDQSCKHYKNDSVFADGFRNRFPRKNIIFVGQLIERKGIIQLLEVYAQIVAKFPEPVGLILIGQGPLKNYIENERGNRKWEHVFLEGFVPYAELPKYYAVADISMLLTLYDRNPLVVFEALACGVPIICSARAGNAVDFVVDGKNGYIVEPMNISDIAGKTIELLQSNKRNTIAAFSKNIVQKANYDDSAKAFIDSCRYVLSKSK